MGGVRVLLVNKFYDLRGGTERVLFDLEEGLRERGHEVAVFANRDSRNRPSAWSEWFAPERDYAHPTLAQRLHYARATIYDRAARAALARLLDEFRPDIVHFHNIYHQLSPSLLDETRDRDLPSVLTLHDYKLACPVYRLFRDGEVCTRCVGTRTPLWCGVHGCSRDSRAESWLLALESTIHRWRGSWERGVGRFLCPSRFLRDLMVRQGLAPNRLEIVRNAPRHVPPLPSADARADRPILLFAGRISPEKGVRVLLEAARRVPEVELRIAGTGPDEEALRVSSADLPQVHWLGHLESEALDRERDRAWAVAVPSLWYENAPLSVVEAELAGRPVLAADHGGLPEMCESGVTGWLLPPGDVPAWSDALRQLARGRDALGAMGERARTRALREHDYGTFLDHHERIYREQAGAVAGGHDG